MLIGPLREPGIPSVCLNDRGLAQWSPPLTANRGNGIDQGLQLRHIVAIGAGQNHGERNALGSGDEVMLGAGTRAIGGVWACF